MQQTYPSRREIEDVADHWAELKGRLVTYVAKRFEYELRTPEESEFQMRVDDLIYTGKIDGVPVIDRFIRDHPQLAAGDVHALQETKQNHPGVFLVRGRKGSIVDTRNFVDDLEYRLLLTRIGPKEAAAFVSGASIITRIVRFRGWWIASGAQSCLGREDRLGAQGLAADLAHNNPQLFFRNPANLEKGREADRRRHEKFMARFGAPWVVDSPAVIEQICAELLLGANEEKKMDDELAIDPATVKLPSDLRQESMVGLVSDPDTGIFLLAEADRFLEVLAAPELVEQASYRHIVLGYLQGKGVSPAMFSVAASVEPSNLDRIFQILLEDPEFSWQRDQESCLLRFNPSFLEIPQYPSTSLMTPELIAGLRHLKKLERERETGKRRQIPKRRKNAPGHEYVESHEGGCQGSPPACRRSSTGQRPHDPPRRASTVALPVGLWPRTRA